MLQDPYKYFRIEARELLDQLSQGVLELEKGARAQAPVARLLRVAHTLKGAARVVKQREIADRAHAVEEVLAPFRESAESLPSERVAVLLELLSAIANGMASVAAPPEAHAEARVAPAADDAPRTVRNDVAEMDALLDGVTELHGHFASVLRASSTLEGAEHLVDLLIEQLAPHRSRGAARTTDAASSEKARSMAEELRTTIAALQRNLASGVEQMDRDVRQLRDSVERLRLVPAGELFTALERAARDVAGAQAKEIVFEGLGRDTRLDAHVLGGVERALQQLVRNAVAHGIETPAERLAAGKPAHGRVVLEVTRRGRRVVFICRDDGRGIDVEGVRRAAERKGVPLPKAREPGPDELVRLLLRSGVSTSRTVTEVSGRGIGLDVVRDAAERLHGEVRVRTEAGRGTTIELVVPLVLASLETIVVQSAGVVAAIPFDAVRGTLRVAADQVARTSRNETLSYEGRTIPLVPLWEALGGALGRSSARSASASSALVVESASGTAAFAVDRLLGTASVTLRPLPELAPCAPVVAGASIDAQGNPLLVLDPQGLVAWAEGTAREPASVEADRLPILVIDDSLTTRMLEQSILESAGYAVELATSAEEGLAKARAARYGLFLVDVEMPGMDGFTFVERTRADADLRGVPAILVTSRNAPEDLERGRAAGASGYVVKTAFDQRELLARIRELTGA